MQLANVRQTIYYNGIVLRDLAGVRAALGQLVVGTTQELASTLEINSFMRRAKPHFGWRSRRSTTALEYRSEYQFAAGHPFHEAIFRLARVSRQDRGRRKRYCYHLSIIASDSGEDVTQRLTGFERVLTGVFIAADLLPEGDRYELNFELLSLLLRSTGLADVPPGKQVARQFIRRMRRGGSVWRLQLVSGSILELQFKLVSHSVTQAQREMPWSYHGSIITGIIGPTEEVIRHPIVWFMITPPAGKPWPSIDEDRRQALLGVAHTLTYRLTRG